MSFVVVKTSRNGQGLFATKKFVKDGVIFEVKGTLYHYLEVNKRAGSFQDNTFRFDEEKYLSPHGELGDFLNHSCEPNSKVLKVQDKIFVAAVKNIGKDEEVLIDYSTILARDDIWKMVCNCGSKNCRKIIKSYNKLPVPLFKTYQERQLIPDYILSI